MTDIVEMMRAAGRDDRLADGALYIKAADEIERLREEVRHLRGAFSGDDNIGCAGGVRTLK